MVAAETLSKFTDYTDRTTCILFGDGAGAAIIEGSEKGNLMKSIVGTEGHGGKDLYLSNLGDRITREKVNPNNKIFQNGKTIYKWATHNIPLAITELLHKNKLQLHDIDWLVTHSANMRIIESICNKLNFPLEKALESVQYCGNTSSASIPLALNANIKKERIKKGDKILMIGFGGGLTYAGIIIEWGK